MIYMNFTEHINHAISVEHKRLSSTSCTMDSSVDLLRAIDIYCTAKLKYIVNPTDETLYTLQTAYSDVLTYISILKDCQVTSNTIASYLKSDVQFNAPKPVPSTDMSPAFKTP
jgi:hypothetical protein